MAKREGPGRLHSIDLLPQEADAEIQWAHGELAARRRTQADILFELNDRLAVVGCGPISSSAFNRYAIGRAAAMRATNELVTVSTAVAAQLGADKADAITKLIAAMVNTAAYRILAGSTPSSKELMEISRAVSSMINAQAKAGEMNRAMKQETREKIDTATEAAVEGLAAKNPEIDKAALLKKIREDIYGVFDKEEAE